MKYFDIIPAFLAELIGTGLLLFFGCAGCIKWDGISNHLQIVLNFGFAVMFVVQIFGCISGAHFNPAVSISAFICKKIDINTTCIYFVAQLIGSWLGFGLLKVLTPISIFNQTSGNSSVVPTAGLCMTLPHSTVSPWLAVWIEFVATAVLILTCCACAWDKRNANHHDSLPLRFGLTVAGLACAMGPYTGASLNPVRSLAPAIWHWNFELQWIYWIGPMGAGIITAYVYQLVFLQENEEKPVENPEEYNLATIKET